jgi:tetratricopeptide (TPR) repeat protein
LVQYNQKKIIFNFLILFLFLFTFILYSENSKEIFSEIKKLISSKKYNEAIELSHKLFEKYPTSEETKNVCLILPTCYEKIGEIEKIEEIYLFAIKQFQDDIPYTDRIKQLLSEYYIKIDKPAKAIETYNEIKNKNYNQTIQFYERIEKIYQEQKKYKEIGELKLKFLHIYSEIVENCSKDTKIAEYHRYKPKVDQEYVKARQLRQVGIYYEKKLVNLI